MNELRRLQKLASPRAKLGPAITYHGRTGRPVVHEEDSRKYIMVRKKGGGTKRLYEGQVYYPGPKGERGKAQRLKL